MTNNRNEGNEINESNIHESVKNTLNRAFLIFVGDGLRNHYDNLSKYSEIKSSKIATMSREEVFERIANQVGRHDCSCNCDECKKMCQRVPCLGTPHDILALIDAGYVDKVCYTEWAAGILLGHIKRTIPMIQIERKIDGSCVFYHDGKCDLHENGLKPTEGKLSHHEVSVKELQKEYNLTYQVAIEWTKEENFGIIKEISDKLCEFMDKNK